MFGSLACRLEKQHHLGCCTVSQYPNEGWKVPEDGAEAVNCSVRERSGETTAKSKRLALRTAGGWHPRQPRVYVPQSGSFRTFQYGRHNATIAMDGVISDKLRVLEHTDIVGETNGTSS